MTTGDATARDAMPWAPTRPATVEGFRRAVGRFATGVCVVTAVDERMDHAMTANALTSVSIDPLLVLVCVETEARFHDAIMAAGEWAVSMLDATARPAATWLATRGRPLHGQLDRVPFRRGPLTGAPLLDQAVAWLECRTYAVYPGGDHSIVVGEVVSVGLGDESAGALLYHRSSYRALGVRP
jgi:flavin reductase (DIM6/NTAB) family NADH-FMN oxidoreductase RutF